MPQLSSYYVHPVSASDKVDGGSGEPGSEDVTRNSVVDGEMGENPLHPFVCGFKARQKRHVYCDRWAVNANDELRSAKERDVCLDWQWRISNAIAGPPFTLANLRDGTIDVKTKTRFVHTRNRHLYVLVSCPRFLFSCPCV